MKKCYSSFSFIVLSIHFNRQVIVDALLPNVTSDHILYKSQDFIIFTKVFLLIFHFLVLYL